MGKRSTLRILVKIIFVCSCCFVAIQVIDLHYAHIGARVGTGFGAVVKTLRTSGNIRPDILYFLGGHLQQDSSVEEINTNVSSPVGDSFKFVHNTPNDKNDGPPKSPGSFIKGDGVFKSGVLSHMLGYDGNSKRFVRDMDSILADKDVILDKVNLSDSFTSNNTSYYHNLLAEAPPKYLPNYKNPCWKEKLEVGEHSETDSQKQQQGSGLGWKLRCLPYLYLAGVHKAGTTDLFSRLMIHPLLTSSKKELHWWSRARSGQGAVRKSFQFPPNSTIKQYVDMFDQASERIYRYTEADPKTIHDYHPMILGEGCPSYLYYTDRWELHPEQQNTLTPRYVIGDYIRHVTPHARIIFSFRNPTERAYSFYKFINGKSIQHFREAVAKGVPIMEACLKNHTSYYCATNHEIIARVRPLNIHMGMYATFLKRWIRIFSWEQIYILRMEDYSKQRPAYVNDIFKFLGIEPLTEEEIERKAKKKKVPTATLR